jgi:hypothetical protein
MIDPQAVVLFKTGHAVIPPRIGFGGVKPQRPRVFQARVHQPHKGVALGGGGKDLSLPAHRIPEVGVGRGDVKVPAQDEVFMRLEFALHPQRQCGDPVELVEVLVRPDFLAVGKVGARQAQFAPAHMRERGRNEPLLLVGVARNVGHHILDGGEFVAFDGHRHAVVALLTAVDDAVARLFKGGGRKEFVHGLGFLHHERGGLSAFQPVEHLRQADFDAVDVPGSNLHGKNSVVNGSGFGVRHQSRQKGDGRVRGHFIGFNAREQLVHAAAFDGDHFAVDIVHGLGPVDAHVDGKGFLKHPALFDGPADRKAPPVA